MWVEAYVGVWFLVTLVMAIACFKDHVFTGDFDEDFLTGSILIGNGAVWPLFLLSFLMYEFRSRWGA